MDITPVFGTVIGGSNPSESTRILKAKHSVFRFLNACCRRDSNGGGLESLHLRSKSGMAELHPAVLNEQGACDDVNLETEGRILITKL